MAIFLFILIILYVIWVRLSEIKRAGKAENHPDMIENNHTEAPQPNFSRMIRFEENLTRDDVYDMIKMNLNISRRYYNEAMSTNANLVESADKCHLATISLLQIEPIIEEHNISKNSADFSPLIESKNNLLQAIESNFNSKCKTSVDRTYHYLSDRISEIPYEKQNYILYFTEMFLKPVLLYCAEDVRRYAVACYDDLKGNNLGTVIPGITTMDYSPSDFRASEFAKVDRMSGVEFEQYCAYLLVWNGFGNIELTKASGDQGVDILAEKDGVKYAFQCKNYSSDLGNTPVQEVNTGRMVYDCNIGVVITNRGFTDGAKLATRKSGVLLWDRDKLRELIQHAEVQMNKQKH